MTTTNQVYGSRPISLAAALQLAGDGFHVFPVNGKVPFKGSHGHLDATTDLLVIRDMFQRHSNAGIGIACGRSGLVVLDVDPPTGEISLKEIRTKYGHLSDTLTVQTPRGGRHLYFAAPPEVTLRPSVSMIGEGIDIRAGSSYVVSPPSAGYHTVDVNTDLPCRARIVKTPDWLLRLLCQPNAVMLQNEQNQQKLLQNERRLSSVHSVTDAVQASLPEHEGQRNKKIFAFARHLKSLPKYVNARPEDLRNEFRLWFDAARSVIRTKVWEDCWIDFIRAWPKAWPMTRDAVTEAFGRSVEKDPPAFAMRYECPQTRRLISLCRELQQLNDADTFYLACSKVQQILGIDRMTAWRRLQVLVADGVLEVADRHTSSRATRYYYRGSETEMKPAKVGNDTQMG